MAAEKEMDQHDTPGTGAISSEAGIGPPGNNSGTLGKDPDTEARKRRFYQAAEPLFTRFGYRKTTVEDICHAAGASKRSFYDLFHDKADLFLHMMFAISEKEVLRWKEKLPAELSPTRKLDSFIELYVSHIASHPIWRDTFNNPDVLRAMGAMMGEIYFSPIVLTLGEILGAGIKSGDFRGIDPEKTLWIILSLLDSVFLLAPELYRDQDWITSRAMVDEVKSFILNGVHGVNHEN